MVDDGMPIGCCHQLRVLVFLAASSASKRVSQKSAGC